MGLDQASAFEVVLDISSKDLVLCAAQSNDFIASSRPTRLNQRMLGQAAAAKALSCLGSATTDFPLERAATGEPLWPKGFVGSLSHTKNLGVALIGKASHFSAVGVDCELWNRELSPEAARRICRPKELELLQENSLPHIVAFSCKETIYKALFPVVQRYFGFRAATMIQCHSTTCTFRIEDELAMEWCPGSVITVHWRQWHGYLLTTIALPSRH